jgi:multiple sugar transport system substrate-binding protein
MDTQDKNTKNLVSRRDFLKLSGAAAAGTWLLGTLPAASAGKSIASRAAQAEGEITFMIHAGELSEDEIAQFMADNPGITLTRLDVDQTKLFALMAAGTPPDVFRLQAPQFPQLLARNIPLNLQSYFEVSSALQLDDLFPANNFYKAVDPFNIGQGDIYGITKDWSPDLTLWVNDDLFEQAGVDLVDDKEPLNYEQVADLASKLTKFEGDQVAVNGFAFDYGWIDRYWTYFLYVLGKSLFTEDFTQINLVNNEEARAAIQYHVDLAKERYTYSPLNVNPTWNGPEFQANLLAICQYGFWFSGFVPLSEDEDFKAAVDGGKIRMVPAPIWQGGVRSSPTITATAAVITAASPNPDQAWTVFEWYNGKEPALARAQSGWGVPALKSLVDQVPHEGTYREQVFAVLNEELNYADTVLPFNPYLVGGEPGEIGSVFQANVETYLNDEMDFDTLVGIIESQTNQAIQDGIDRIG